MKIYLDDVRTPKDKDWMVVRNYHEFVNLVQKLGLKNIGTISLDHDLGDSAMTEYHTNVSPNFKLSYENITEKTGYDCAKWLVTYCAERKIKHPPYIVHSLNSVGKLNIEAYIDSYNKTL